MAASKLMKALLREVIRGPHSGVIRARRNADGTYSFDSDISGRLLKDHATVCINEDLMEWDVFIDITKFVPAFNTGFGDNRFPRVNSYCFTLRNLEPSVRTIETVEFLLYQDYNFRANIEYELQDLYPSGWLHAKLSFPSENNHLSVPRLIFTSEIFHPNIVQDGTVNLDIYAEDWRSGRGVKNMLDSIIKILKEPREEYIVNTDLRWMSISAMDVTIPRLPFQKTRLLEELIILLINL